MTGEHLVCTFPVEKRLEGGGYAQTECGKMIRYIANDGNSKSTTNAREHLTKVHGFSSNGVQISQATIVVRKNGSIS